MLPEVPRAVLILSLLGGCGRLGFDVDDQPIDASVDAPDAMPGSYTDVVLADTPRFLYRLDESAGPTAYDRTAQHDAGYQLFGGTLTFGQPGALLRESNTAVLIEGDGNSGPNIGASVENAPIDVFQGDFTIELFFKPTGIPIANYHGALFLCEDYLSSGFRTGPRDDLNLELWTDEGGGTSTIIGTTPLVLGVWSYVVFVKRGETAEIWLDGTLLVSGALDMSPPSLTTGRTECGFGAFHGLPAYGVFDEVAAYDKALSPAQIAQHFAAR